MRRGRRCGETTLAPEEPPQPAITWWCGCGEHGMASGQPAAARALAAHLTSRGHRSGEYSYGRAGQRTVVEMTVDDGTITHTLADGPAP